MPGTGHLRWSGTSDDDTHRVPSGRSVGSRCLALPVLNYTVTVGRPHGDRVVAGRCIPVQNPLTPGLGADIVAESGHLPRPVIDLHLNLAHPLRRRPSDTRDGSTSLDDDPPWSRHIDSRLGLDWSLLRPAPRNPIRVERFPSRQLDLGQPLCRRDIPVQARDDEASRESVRDRRVTSGVQSTGRRIPIPVSSCR
ncbi:hypothetical protein BMS3Abin02_02290 [bacterium BMS3Abin02]|nr:hypothetical protein BMS3Abin02_02290 [bacterium BMS3Abin02]GBE21533.1 hypothetical protein BMS3Bbin01_00878 [bacterium BMS3Bbin01]